MSTVWYALRISQQKSSHCARSHCFKQFTSGCAQACSTDLAGVPLPGLSHLISAFLPIPHPHHPTSIRMQRLASHTRLRITFLSLKMCASVIWEGVPELQAHSEPLASLPPEDRLLPIRVASQHTVDGNEVEKCGSANFKAENDLCWNLQCNFKNT